jgi:hypothetical protein
MAGNSPLGNFAEGGDLTGLLYQPLILVSSFLQPLDFIHSCFTLFFCFSARSIYKMDTHMSELRYTTLLTSTVHVMLLPLSRRY